MNNVKVTPRGWLLEYLQTQMQGLTGHIEKAGYPFDRKFWGEKEPKNQNSRFWWPFEQTAYHIDGYVRAAILLGDEEMITKAADMIYPALESADENGYIGHKRIKEANDNCEYWPHVVFFRACLALYSYNHDKKIISALTAHYLGNPDTEAYSKIRNVYNVEIMLALYDITGDKRLLALAVESYEKGKDNIVRNAVARVNARAHIHGVTYNEYAKLGALLYRATGKKTYLSDSVKAYEKIRRRYLLPGGCCSSSEYMLDNSYYETYETCDIADMTWSLHYLAEICDEPMYSDIVEKCVFNAGIGSVTEDFRALQYFSCANQIILDRTSSHCRFETGTKAMAYAPMPFTACCPGNVNRIIPNYALSMWSLKGSTVTARMYGPSEYSGEIDGKAFSITQKTTYPFDLKITFEVKTVAPITLRLRVPGWCKGSGGAVKGGKAALLRGNKDDGNFMSFALEGDAEITVEFIADIAQRENRGGVYFERGPLVYSLGMKGERHTSGDADFPAYEMYANEKWNYAADTACKPEFTAGRDAKWTFDADLPYITVNCREVQNYTLKKAKKIRCVNWKYEPRTKIFDSPITITPRLPQKKHMMLAEESVRVRLYPYGACKLRMTVLPKIEK